MTDPILTRRAVRRIRIRLEAADAISAHTLPWHRNEFRSGELLHATGIEKPKPAADDLKVEVESIDWEAVVTAAFGSGQDRVQDADDVCTRVRPGQDAFDHRDEVLVSSILILGLVFGKAGVPDVVPDADKELLDNVRARLLAGSRRQSGRCVLLGDLREAMDRVARAIVQERKRHALAEGSSSHA